MTDNTRALVDQLKAALEILAIGAHRRKLQEEAAYGPCFSATRVERARDEYKAVKDAIAAVDQWLQQPEQDPVAWLYRSITGIQRLHTEQGPMLKADMDAARDFPHAHSCVSLGLVHPLGQLPLGNGAGESVLANAELSGPQRPARKDEDGTE